MTNETLIALIGFLGACFGYWLKFAQDRYARRNSLTDERRKSYATWLVSEAMMYSRIKAACKKITGFSKDWEIHDAAAKEVDTLNEEVRPLLVSMIETSLIESRRGPRKLLSEIQSTIETMLDQLTFAIRHYKENLEIHENIEEGLKVVEELQRQYSSTSEELAAFDGDEETSRVSEARAELIESTKRLEEAQAVWNENNDSLLQHEVVCPFKNGKFERELLYIGERMHSLAGKLRDSVAPSLSE